MTTICPPALIYIVFSLTQIILDLVKGLYNTAFMKFIVMSIIGFLLIDPRCFILQSSVSQQPQHGMRAGNISDNVYCPWMQNAQ